MKRNNRIWTVAYTDLGRDKYVANMTKAEAKLLWGELMDTFGRNLIMSGECKEAYLSRDGETIAMKSGAYWFVRGELVNGMYESKEQVLALI